MIDAKPALPFQMIRVKPAARLDRLEDVLVLLSQQELEPRKTGDAASPLIPAPANPRSCGRRKRGSLVPHLRRPQPQTGNLGQHRGPSGIRARFRQGGRELTQTVHTSSAANPPPLTQPRPRQ